MVKSGHSIQHLFRSVLLQRQRILQAARVGLVWLYVSVILDFTCYLVWFDRLFFGSEKDQKCFPYKLVMVLLLRFMPFRLAKGFLETFCFRKPVFIVSMKNAKIICAATFSLNNTAQGWTLASTWDNQGPRQPRPHWRQERGSTRRHCGWHKK